VSELSLVELTSVFEDKVVDTARLSLRTSPPFEQYINNMETESINIFFIILINKI
jgi:hypothetical protein